MIGTLYHFYYKWMTMVWHKSSNKDRLYQSSVTPIYNNASIASLLKYSISKKGTSFIREVIQCGDISHLNLEI